MSEVQMIKVVDPLPEDLGEEGWYHLTDTTDRGRDDGWAPRSGIQNLLEDGWDFTDQLSKELYLSEGS